MRVITGKAKGKKLKSPNGLYVRPTTDRVKESVFNILGHIPNDSIVLDLYSGSGNVGVEFLSRGADKCYFIDSSDDSIKIIKENLIITKLIEQAIVYKNKVYNAINFFGIKSNKFDYIYMDPPYEKGLIIPTIEEIYKADILKDNGLIIAEHESKMTLPCDILGYIKIQDRKYGNITISFYKFGGDKNESNLSR